jgi:hypothetical protein
VWAASSVWSGAAISLSRRDLSSCSLQPHASSSLSLRLHRGRKLKSSKEDEAAGNVNVEEEDEGFGS